MALVIHWQGGDHTEMTVKKNKSRTDPLDGRGRCRRSRSSAGTATAGHVHRSHPESLRQADGAWRYMDTHPCLWSSQFQRHSRLSRRRTSRARRDNARRSCRNSKGKPRDGLSNGQQWRASSQATVRRGALDNPACRPAAGRPFAATPRPGGRDARYLKIPCKISLDFIRTSPDEQYDAPTSLPANSAFFLLNVITRSFCPCRPGVGSPLPVSPILRAEGSGASRGAASDGPVP